MPVRSTIPFGTRSRRGTPRLQRAKAGQRRYRPDVSVFWGVEALDPDGWAALATLAGPGHGVVLARPELGELPSGWTMLGGGVGLQMVAGGLTANGPGAPPPDQIRALGSDDVGAMVELVRVDRTGPLRSPHDRARRLLRRDGRWPARGDGRRTHATSRATPRSTAVCTHPDTRGHGLASLLTRRVADGIHDRGETPILHVRRDNHTQPGACTSGWASRFGGRSSSAGSRPRLRASVECDRRSRGRRAGQAFRRRVLWSVWANGSSISTILSIVFSSYDQRVVVVDRDRDVVAERASRCP